MKNLYLIAFMLLFFSCTETSYELIQESDLQGKEKSLTIELIESQAIFVTSTYDNVDFEGNQKVQDLPGSDGLISFREAIIAANNTEGPNLIGFNISTDDPGFDGQVFTILPLSRLPSLLENGTTINGATQKDYTGNTNQNGPEIVLDGSSMEQPIQNEALGIYSKNNTVHEIVVSNYPSGIAVGGENNKITGCFIGTDASGSFIKVPQSNFFGIGVENYSKNNQIGSLSSDENRIAGYERGIWTSNNCSQIIIENNSIGYLNEDNEPLGNVWGITVNDNCSYFTIRNNKIVGNSQKGITICLSNNIQIEGNLIDGAHFDNGPQGIAIDGFAPDNLSSNITIGGSTTEKANIIKRNPGGGIVFCTVTNALITGNEITENGMSGIHIYGSYNQNSVIIQKNKIFNNFGSGISINRPGTGYRITQNSIYNNLALGIELAPEECCSEGVTLNDPGDFDSGPNNLMNFPVITSAKSTSGQLIVRGEIDTHNPKTVTVELFANPVPSPGKDPTGYGEGAIYLGSVHPNPQGKFTATLPTVLKGTYITATATDDSGNTSEFSLNIEATTVGK